HTAASEILTVTRPNLVAQALVEMWCRIGVPRVAQFDNHTNFRGAIPPAYAYFGPVVATCLDLDVTPRFIPLREPWRNGVVEHFNDVWDKSFFRTEVFTGLDHLRVENAAFGQLPAADPAARSGPHRSRALYPLQPCRGPVRQA